MPPVERHLHVVPSAPGGGTAPVPRELADVGLTAMIFGLASLPLASALAGRGSWGEGSLGLATVGVLLAGRELCTRAVERWRRRARPSR